MRPRGGAEPQTKRRVDYASSTARCDDYDEPGGPLRPASVDMSLRNDVETARCAGLVVTR
jgi:hypothetical protein